MIKIAIFENDTVINVIVCENLEVAQNLIGSNVFVIPEERPIGIGWTKIQNQWMAPKPFASWIIQDGFWVAPIPEPKDGKIYDWNEEMQSWIEVIP